MTIRSAARFAVCALITWDSSADLLDLPADALRTMIDLAPEPVCHRRVKQRRHDRTTGSTGGVPAVCLNA